MPPGLGRQPLSCDRLSECGGEYPQHGAGYQQRGRGGGLDDIPGVGKGIADALQKVLSEGHFAEFDDLIAEVPQGVVEMMDVPDMGPKKAKRLWDELGLDSVDV